VTRAHGMRMLQLTSGRSGAVADASVSGPECACPAAAPPAESSLTFVRATTSTDTGSAGMLAAAGAARDVADASVSGSGSACPAAAPPGEASLTFVRETSSTGTGIAGMLSVA